MKQKPESICTISLIVINIAVFLLLSLVGNTEDAIFMLKHGAMQKLLVINDHQYYRIVSSIFLHFGIAHLMNNMVMLGALGWILERETGRVRFVIIYMVSGIGGNLLSLADDVIHNNYAVSAGASGAIFGLMGALLYVVIVNRGRLGSVTGKGMLFMVALSLYLGINDSGVDIYAHIGGLICGFIMAVILYRRRKEPV